jgi:hypothetical protein
MPEIKPEQLLIIVGFILPGAISMCVYGLKVPQKELALKDRIVEAVCFSMLNFLVVWLPTQWLLGLPAASEPIAIQWIVLVSGFIFIPVLWPFLRVVVLQWAEQHGWIAVRAKTSWDDFFGRRNAGCWLQIVLNDDTVIGGRFDTRSYASSWPDPGHLYLEALWHVDPFGVFRHQIVGNPGVLLRPSDYKRVLVYTNEAVV